MAQEKNPGPAPPAPAERESRIPTNLRTLMILESLGRGPDAITPAELGRRIGLPKQTVHRLCNTLLEEGFLVRAESDGGLRPGRRAREMASAILHDSSAHIARHQVLMRLAEEVGETINFVVPEDQGMSYKDRVETNWAIRIQLPVGSHVPFHCTASGKTFLSTLPRGQRQRLVQAIRLDQWTPNTITQSEALLDDLERIARRGYALDDEEMIEGMVAAAVPVRDPQGRDVASLACHAPVQRISITRAAEELAPKLAEASRRLTGTLF